MTTQSALLSIDPHTHQLIGPDRFSTFTASQLARLVFPLCIVCGRFAVKPEVSNPMVSLADSEPKFVLRGGAWTCPGGCDPRPGMNRGDAG
jgi:hypothetical protein